MSKNSNYRRTMHGNVKGKTAVKTMKKPFCKTNGYKVSYMDSGMTAADVQILPQKPQKSERRGN